MTSTNHPVARCGRTDEHGAHAIPGRTPRSRQTWCAGNRNIVEAVDTEPFEGCPLGDPGCPDDHGMVGTDNAFSRNPDALPVESFVECSGDPDTCQRAADDLHTCGREPWDDEADAEAERESARALHSIARAGANSLRRAWADADARTDAGGDLAARIATFVPWRQTVNRD